MPTPDLFKKKLSILQEVSSALVETDDMDSLANLMLDLAVNYANAEKGSLMLVNDCGELHILAARGIDQHVVSTYRGRTGEGFAGIVARDRLPVLVQDVDADGRFRGKTRDHYRTKSFISCPLANKDHLLGVLNINDKKDGTPFTADEFELMTIMANHAAIAFEKTRLLAQLKSKAAELEDINRKLIETDIGKMEFFSRVSHELRTPLNSVKGAVYHLLQADLLPKAERREFHAIIASETDKLIDIVENLLNFLRLDDEMRLIRKSVIGLEGLLKTLSHSPSLKTMLVDCGVRLRLTASDTATEIVGDTANVLQLFTNLIAGILPHCVSGDQIELSVEEKNAVIVQVSLPRGMPETVLSSLNGLPEVVHGDHSEDQLKLLFARSAAGLHRWKMTAANTGCGCRILLTMPKSARENVEAFVSRSMDSFVEFIAELLDLEICSIMLCDEPAGELTVRSARGLDDDIVRQTRIKFGDKIAGRVALEGKPLFVDDIERDPRFAKKSIAQYSTKSFMSLPLKIEECVVGVLNLNNKKTAGPFTLRDYYIASVISERISHFMKLAYADAPAKDGFSQFLTSFKSRMFDAGPLGGEQQDLPPPSPA